MPTDDVKGGRGKFSQLFFIFTIIWSKDFFKLRGVTSWILHAILNYSPSSMILFLFANKALHFVTFVKFCHSIYDAIYFTDDQQPPSKKKKTKDKKVKGKLIY